MFLLVCSEDVEDIRELIDYATLSAESATEDESSTEDESATDEQTYVASKVPENLFHNVPNGIITTKSWDALTFYTVES
jgi:hypothetical protein